MISMAELNAAWDAIIPMPGQSVGRRADENHPLDFFITYDENGNMQMILTADFLPSVPASSRQLSVRANARHDGRYALCFSLADKSLREQYVSLCWDIMNCTSAIENKKQGTAAAIKRFCLWQRLFAEEKSKLSDAEIKGLIGELCALKQVVFASYTPNAALTGWVGPIGADRDFEMPAEWYEVKAVSLSKDTVSISSLDQLDTDMEGSLLIARIEKASPNATDCFTLNSLVNEIAADVADLESRTIFNARMASAKYDPADPRAEEPYVLHRIEVYRTDRDFPRIRRSKVPVSISNAAYDLSIPGLQDWRQS